jgi:hypothetical protein
MEDVCKLAKEMKIRVIKPWEFNQALNKLTWEERGQDVARHLDEVRSSPLTNSYYAPERLNYTTRCQQRLAIAIPKIESLKERAGMAIEKDDTLAMLRVRKEIQRFLKSWEMAQDSDPWFREFHALPDTMLPEGTYETLEQLIRVIEDVVLADDSD